MPPAPSLHAETELLKEAYAALNRGDIPAMLRAFDPNIERVEPFDFPGGGTYRGLAAVEAHFAKARAAWAEGACEPQSFTTIGDKVIALVHVRVRLKHEAQWREGDVADVFAFARGRVTAFHTFANADQALTWISGP